MYKLSTSFLFFYFLTAITGCIKKQAEHPIDVLSIDIKSEYPTRILPLQDIMDVEYVALETTDEFVTHGAVQAVGKDILLVKNWGNNGDIFLFDRKTGKGIRKINRLGQGAEEYFMQLMEKSMDFNTFKGFPTTDLVYDTQEKVVYTYKMYNQDFTDDRSCSLSIHPNTTRDSDVLAFKVLQSDDLVNTLNENELQGTLKDIVSTLDEESNPVVMLIKHKNL